MPFHIEWLWIMKVRFRTTNHGVQTETSGCFSNLRYLLLERRFIQSTFLPIHAIFYFFQVNYTSIQSDNRCFQSHYKVSQFSVSLAWRDRMLAEIAILRSTLMTLGSYGILESALLSMCRTNTVLLSTMCVWRR